MRETFLQLCVYFTICLLAATIFINFVSTSGIYGDVSTIGQGANINTSDVNTTLLGFIQTTEEGSKITELGMWATILSAIGIIGGLIYLVTGDSNMVGAWIFCAVFWSSWGSLFFITEIGGWIPLGITFGATILMIPIFYGGLIGILSGSG
jgi:hypothetical protein